MKSGAAGRVMALALLVGAGTAGAAVKPFEVDAAAVPHGKIDELVFARLRAQGIQPAHPCTDAVFVRRVYLDVTGALPTAREAAEFILDDTPGKREELIDRLLDSPAYADYMAMKWCDALRVKAEFPINLWPNAVQAYHRWIRDCVQNNVPYDRFVRDMLTANGSNFRVAPVNFLRATQNPEPPAMAAAVALSFMGARAEKWPAERLAGLAAFFAKVGVKGTGEWKEQILFFDPAKVSTNPAVAAAPVFPDGRSAKLAKDQDPRVALADWLVAPDNPWFARAAANRAWSWLMGRGIVHEPDDFRDDNPPSNPELLAHLQARLVASKFDLQALYREILNSQTYQLSSIPGSADPRAEALFAFYPVRRLEAEVVIDALCDITGTSEEYSSAVPEPFTFVPKGARATQLPDGSITSSFLELFGRPPRDTGYDSERNNKPSAAQRLHLLNSSHVRRKVENGPKILGILNSSNVPDEVANRLYLAILSRYPTLAELAKIRDYGTGGGAGGKKAWMDRQAGFDLAWALINSTEFLYRH